MVRFETKIIRDYSKLMQSLIDTEDLYSENCFLNFTKGTIEFKSGITKEGQEIFGSLKVPFEGDHKNFWVDASLFLHLCNSYDTLIIDNKIFKNGTLIFELKNMEDGDLVVSFEDFSWDTAKAVSMSTISSLIEASQFSGERFPHVAVGDLEGKQIIAGSDGVCYYENIVEEQLGIQFSKTMIRLLSEAGNKKVVFDSSENKVYFNINQEVELITSLIEEESVPCTDRGFRSMLTSTNPLLTFKKTEMQNTIKFLKPFFAKNPRQIFAITLLEDKMEIRPDVADNKAVQTVACEYRDPAAVGKKFGMLSMYFEKILRGISTEKVVLSTNNNSAPNFGILSKDSEDMDEKYMVKFIVMED